MKLTQLLLILLASSTALLIQGSAAKSTLFDELRAKNRTFESLTQAEKESLSKICPQMKMSPLFFCLEQSNADNKELARNLLAIGVDPNIGTEKYTPLMMASGLGELSMVELLLSDPRTEKEAADPHGFTALLFATTQGNLPCVRALIKKGALTNVTTKKMNSAPTTLLGKAVTTFNHEIVEAVVDAGAPVTDEEVTIAKAAYECSKHDVFKKFSEQYSPDELDFNHAKIMLKLAEKNQFAKKYTHEAHAIIERIARIKRHAVEHEKAVANAERLAKEKAYEEQMAQKEAIRLAALTQASRDADEKREKEAQKKRDDQYKAEREAEREAQAARKAARDAKRAQQLQASTQTAAAPKPTAQKIEKSKTNVAATAPRAARPPRVPVRPQTGPQQPKLTQAQIQALVRQQEREKLARLNERLKVINLANAKKSAAAAAAQVTVPAQSAGAQPAAPASLASATIACAPLTTAAAPAQPAHADNLDAKHRAELSIHEQLLQAAKKADYATMHMLIDMNANIKILDEYGNSLLMIISSQPTTNKEMLQNTIKLLAPLYTKRSLLGWTPLASAAFYGQTTTVEALLTHCAHDIQIADLRKARNLALKASTEWVDGYADYEAIKKMIDKKLDA